MITHRPAVGGCGCRLSTASGAGTTSVNRPVGNASALTTSRCGPRLPCWLAPLGLPKVCPATRMRRCCLRHPGAASWAGRGVAHSSRGGYQACGNCSGRCSHAGKGGLRALLPSLCLASGPAPFPPRTVLLHQDLLRLAALAPASRQRAARATIQHSAINSCPHTRACTAPQARLGWRFWS